jgi:hypothetical protein
VGGSTTTLGSDGQAWRMSGNAVAVRDGQQWTTFTPPHTPAPGDSVGYRGQFAVVASLSGTTMTVSSSQNGGSTWTDQTVQLPAAADAASVTLAQTGQQYVVGPEAIANTGSASQASTAFVSNTDGSLTEITLPGSLLSLLFGLGLMLDVGGPANSDLYLSTDLGLSWTDVSVDLLGFTPPTVDVPPTEPSFGSLVALSDGTAIIPTVTSSDSGLTLDFQATTTGLLYNDIGSVTIPGDYGGGPIDVDASSYGPTEAVFANPGTTDLTVVNDGGIVTTISSSGLPVPPDSITFQDSSNGQAQVTQDSCTDGKDSCTETVSQFSTTDGGATWTAD